MAIKHTMSADRAPTVSDDDTKGWCIGSFWLDKQNDALYFCESADSGTANWLVLGDSSISNGVNGMAKSNWSADRDPLATDDRDSGWEVGSFWLNKADNQLYFCESADSNTAVWICLGAEGIIPNTGKLVIVGGDSTAGGRIIMGYGNSLATDITTQQDNTWVVDVHHNTHDEDDFRVLNVSDSSVVSVGFAVGPDGKEAGFKGPLRVLRESAIPAGGTADTGLLFSASADYSGTKTHFGIFFGSGAPTLSADQGSLYLRTDGSTTNDRMYVNTNGTTGWTAVTTAA